MKRVILYLRVSTNSQAEEGYSIDIQKERLLAFCKAHGWIVVGIITDPGFSGSNLERPGIQRVIHEVENKNTDMVLVYKLDRLSRSQKDTLWLIEDCFLPNGVDFTSMQESLDTSTQFGRAMLGILSVFAQLERENIKERTFGGRVERAKEGLWHGGGNDPIGYNYVDGELVINHHEASQVRRVFDLYASGASVTEIRDFMVSRGYQTKHGDWTHTNTIRSVLDNELYTGVVHFDGEKSDKNAHPAIISRALFERVRHLRERSLANQYKEVESDHLLTGFVYCGSCGARYFPKKNRSGNVYYCCYSRAKVNKAMVKDPNCRNENIKNSELESMVEVEILKLATDEDYLHETIKNRAALGSDSASASIREELAAVDLEIKQAMDGYQKPGGLSVDEVSAKINELYNKKLILSEKVGILDKKVKAGFNGIPDSVRLLLKDVSHSWGEWGVKHRRYVLRHLLDKIEIEGGVVRFTWAFV